MSSPPSAVVLDHTALLALGAGSRVLSGLVTQAHAQSGRYVYAPALCLTAAIAQRPELADHIGMLPAVQVIDLDYAASAGVGAVIATGVDWRAAHAIVSGRPTADWPSGRLLLSTTPDSYAGWGVEVRAVS